LKRGGAGKKTTENRGRERNKKESQREAKPMRAGGWEERQKLKRGAGRQRHRKK